MGVINSDNLGYLWNKIGSAVKTAITTYLGDYTTYSTTPKKVGTWVDGTPVWRVVFDISLLDENGNNTVASYIKSYDKMEDRFEYYIVNYMENYVSNLNYFFVLDCKATLGTDLLNCIIDDYSLTYEGNGYLCLFNPYINSNADVHNHIYGWIDFVSPESNIL